MIFVIKKILLVLLWIFLGILALELILFMAAPVYDFPLPKPFSGEKIHNPYDRMNSNNWRKANFHFHVNAWGGLTSGRNNTVEEFWNTYKKLGYDVPSISDYQRINRFNSDSSFYIPTYEHGFGVRKKHQMLIGARKVLWLDYSLVQNLSHKQHILNLLHDQSEIVAIAHPDWEGGYSLDDMKLLSNYQLIEVLDNNWRSVPQWDAALSAGHPAYILADDDAHDIRDPYQIGRCCTFINSPTLSSADLVTSLKNGNAFGAEVYMSDGETFAEKAERATRIPVLQSVEVRGDTLWVKVSEKAFKFVFIGQNGKAKKVARFTNTAGYKIQPGDTYIRTEIQFFNHYGGPGTIFYLNPVFRYSGDLPLNVLEAKVNPFRTWFNRLVLIPAIFFLAVYAVYRRNRKTIKNIPGEGR
jgi:hypothetical protein